MLIFLKLITPSVYSHIVGTEGMLYDIGNL